MKSVYAFFISSLIFISIQVSAQSDLQNTGIINITSGSNFYINGSVTNAVTAALTNNGNIYITQHLTNSQVAVPVGAGTLIMVGSAQQMVAGAQPFRTFNLITDNTSGILLNNNLSISGTHTFTNGIIESSATPNYLIYEAGSSYTGSADSRHVSGWVKKMGSTGFIFPVGTGVVLRPVELNNLSSSSEFNTHHFVSTPNTGNVLAPLVQIDPYEYWEINRISGGDAQVAMNWDRSKVEFPQYVLSTIRAAYYTAGQWTNEGGSATGDVATTGNITSNSMSVFGQFTMGSISAVLPVSFVSVTATRNMNVVLIEWKANNEINVDHYEVERSEDGRRFSKAGTVPAATGTGIINYNYSDDQRYSGQLWYRIRNVDIDGKYKFSNIVTVQGNSPVTGFFTVINPARNAVSFISNAMQPGSYIYQLRNDGGQTVQSGRIEIAGNGRYSIELKNREIAGIYIFTISKAAFIQNERIWIMK
jgi:hypothetical protein